MHFKSDAAAARRARFGCPCGCCSLCARTLLRGEKGWYLNGQSICVDCFVPFARAELSDCEVVFGTEEEA